MKLTTQILIVGIGAKPDVAVLWINSLQAACDRFQITTAPRMASFLANIGVESAGLTAMEENLNYSTPERLAAVWPSRYAVDPKARPPVPNDLAKKLAKNPQGLANNVYANRMGNGNEDSGDGWKYRGQGPIQLTGKDNITKAAQGTGIDFVGHPELLRQPDGGSMASAWFFASRGCNDAMDRGDFARSVALINGQPPCDVNHGPLRKQRFYDCLKVIGTQ